MSPTENKCHIQPLLTRTDPRVTLRPSETKGRWMSRSLADIWVFNPARPDLVYRFIYSFIDFFFFFNKADAFFWREEKKKAEVRKKTQEMFFCVETLLAACLMKFGKMWI